MVIIERAAEIDAAGREVVVIEAVGSRRPVDDEEGQHLVERVRQFGVEAARVDRVDGETAAGAVERAGLVAEAVMALVIVAGHEMRERARAGRNQISLRRAVLQERLVLAVAAPGDAEGRERNFGAQSPRGNDDLARVGPDIRPRAGEAREALARTPFIGRLQPARCDRPATVEPVAILRLQRHPADIAFENTNGERMAEPEIEQGGFAIAAEIAALRQGFHGLVSEYLGFPSPVIPGLRAAKSPEPRTDIGAATVDRPDPPPESASVLGSGLRPSACPGMTAQIFKP